MRGGLIGRVGHIVGAVALALGVALSAAAEQANPRAVVYELIDQLQTGQPRPVDLAPAMRKVIAEQTGNTGMYPSLARLGVVTYVRIDQTTPMRRGTLYSVTATHDKGVSTWQVGIIDDSNRVEYVEFKIAKSEAALPPASTAPSTATKPRAPSPVATPMPSHPSPPAASPSSAPPAVSSAGPPNTPAPAPRVATPSETSAACQKFPNLC